MGLWEDDKGDEEGVTATYTHVYMALSYSVQKICIS
jgi:hypothetical protein|nr:hypothetical protein [Mucilaginibacter sp. X4EP1]